MSAPFPIVEVAWLDAHVSTSSKTVKKAVDIKPVLTRTVGYLMAENDHGVILATDCYPDHRKEGKIINMIPWGMIEGYWELRDG